MKHKKIIMDFPEVETEEEVDVITVKDIFGASRVLLFNDEIHTFDEVINQIIKAINCDVAHAEQITVEVHTKGKAVVFEGEMFECIKVSSVLEEIALHTQIEC
ncbi:MAG: ATP-dependent Clp protease adaptor ClpS [Firmicutes bacterium]|nr:ATP-dependent Clp protease adaptor ClpS [Bacillota bacterium]